MRAKSLITVLAVIVGIAAGIAAIQKGYAARDACLASQASALASVESARAPGAQKVPGVTDNPIIPRCGDPALTTNDTAGSVIVALVFGIATYIGCMVLLIAMRLLNKLAS